MVPPGNTPSNPSIAPPVAPPGERPSVAPLGSSSAEDLASSWRAALAVKIGPASTLPSCGEGELPVPGGPFLMGSQSDHAGRDEHPVHVVTLTGYCLDEQEVTAAAFARWLRSSGRTAVGEDLRSMSADGVVEPGREKHPAEGVTHQEAQDFCLAAGKTLPTEAQWEKAARGGCELGDDPHACDPGDLRPYPWGSGVPSCDRANHQTTAEGFPRLCVSDTVEVGTGDRGVGPYGHRHLSGNVWEVVADFWHPGIYGQGEPRVDPAGPGGGENHVLKGGGWNTFSTNMRVANRFHDLVMGSATGFRCARSEVASIPDDVAPLEMVALSGTVRREQGVLSGRALYVSAFDQADTDPGTGMLAPGRSPVAEVRLVPQGQLAQAFSIRVPQGGTYVVSAALDDGSGGGKEAFISASGSGGFGQATQNPVAAEGGVGDLTIVLLTPQSGGPGGPPPGGPQGPPLGPPPQGKPPSGPR